MPDEPSLHRKLLSYSCALLGGAIVGGLAGVWGYMGLATRGGPTRSREVAEWARHDADAVRGPVIGGALLGACLAAAGLYGADPAPRRRG